MTDTKVKGSGNSRLLTSVPNLRTLAPTWDAALDLLTGEGLPVDLSNLLAIGCEIIGTALNKANLLSDATEQAIWGSAANRTPDAALKQLRSLITVVQNTANTKAKIEVGSYVGTGLYGKENPTSITFKFAPEIVMLPALYGGTSLRTIWMCSMANMPTSYSSGYGFFQNVGDNGIFYRYGKKSSDGKTLSWYVNFDTSLTNWAQYASSAQCNASGSTYNYLAIG